MITSPAITLGTASRPKLSPDGKTITITIPITLRRLGGRKQVMTQAAQSQRSGERHVDHTLIKALARAHRWRGLLESGRYRTVRALAQAESINESYLCRTLRLTLLSPKLTEAILDGRQPPDLDLAKLLRSIPTKWEEQETLFSNPHRH